MRISDERLELLLELEVDRRGLVSHVIKDDIGCALTELQTLRELAYETQNTLNIYTPKEVVEALKKWEEL